MSSKSEDTAQVPPTLATGRETATGVALAEHEIPEGEDRGSKIEIAGGAPKPDSERPKNSGAQTEPARFTSNGQIPHNNVGSPTGSVPVGALDLTVEEAEARVQATNDDHDAYVAQRGKRTKLAAETIHRLPAVEIRAIAEQRGYVLPEFAGTRATRTSFLKAQDEDTQIEDTRKSAKKTGAKKRRR